MRISLPLFRTKFSRKSVYKTHGSSSFHIEKAEYLPNFVLGRYFVNKKVHRKNLSLQAIY